ncbi:MAG: VWA domain-containing protein [Pseudomonadota bacterium]
MLTAFATGGCRMRIGNEWALWLLVAVPLIAGVMILSFYLKTRALQRFAAGAKDDKGVERKWGWEQLAAKVSLTRRAIKAVLLVVILGLCIMALARPQYGGTEKMLKVKGIDMAVALDFSKSMLAKDVRPDRIGRAKQEVNELIRKLIGDRVGVVAFAGSAVSFPLTTDYDAISLFLRDLSPNDMPFGGTNIGGAIEAGVTLLTADPTSRKRSKVLLLITDGEDHEGEGVKASKEAEKQGIRIFVLGVGTETAELIPRYLEDGTQDGFKQDSDGSYVTTSLTPENEDGLKQIAKNTKGIYIRSAPGKISVFPVAEEIRKLKQAELKARKVTIYDEFYLWLLIPAFILLVLESLINDAKIWFPVAPGRRRET